MILITEILTTMNKIAFKVNGDSLDLLDKDNVFFSFFHNWNRHYLQKGPSNIGLDILTIGLIVSIVDKRILRSFTLDGWTRDISIEIPVIEYEKWILCVDDLNSTLSFLSGDIWNISFVKRTITDIEKDFVNKKKRIKKSSLGTNEEVDFCMLSGGLDSFIGAIDLLKENKRKTIFVNVHGSGSSFKQDFIDVRESLCGAFVITNKDEFFKTYNITIRNGSENTTRSRSFMFFAHALALSTCFNNPQRLIIPENGTISLNVPLTSGRYGSSSTRTTHPNYISGLQRMIEKLGMSIKLVNPYQFKTKGEMINDCKEKTLLENNIVKTMSCSHPTSMRWYKRIGTPSHCGYCLPCLIRKAAELKGFGKIITKYNDVDIIKTNANQSTIKCLKIKLHNSVNEDPLVNVLKNGRIVGKLADYVDLYIRSLSELKALVDGENK